MGVISERLFIPAYFLSQDSVTDPVGDTSVCLPLIPFCLGRRFCSCAFLLPQHWHFFSAIPHSWWVRWGVRKEENCWSRNSQPPGRREGEDCVWGLRPFCSSKFTASWSAGVQSGYSWYLRSLSIRTTILSLELSAMILRFCYIFWSAGVSVTKVHVKSR